MQKIKIVFLDTQTVGEVPNMGLFNSLGEFISYPLTLPQDRVKNIGNADVVITNKVMIDREVMDACPNLKLICIAATGINNIDTEYAKAKGIAFKNVVDYSTESVAQLTIAMILHLVSKLGYFDTYVKSGTYTKSPMFTHLGRNFFELKGKRAGIIGLGNIGKRVAQLLEAFGMQVAYYSTSGNNTHNTYPREELDNLLRTSDIISIHAPLNDRTRNLIDISKLKIMKPSAILINVGRGGIVNEADLVQAINHEYIAGAGVDVFEQEPMLDSNPLLQADFPEKFIFTPHIAWASIEARTLLIEKIGENIKQFLKQ
ncbi:MAG TPA: D-2-hydroxyacid dehydrogenase [Bacteroidales bacterium]|nr:D-2-hydroxyacid dehydrogenase [Bacteroidales bacterium]